jgi:hypothetical protein
MRTTPATLTSVSVVRLMSSGFSSGKRGGLLADVPETPWKRIQQGRRARKSEEQAAREQGGRRQPASGAKWFAKGDLRANGFLIEDKFTEVRNGEPAKSFTITVDMWRKIEREAASTPPGLRPSLRLSMPGIPKLRVVLEDDLLYYLSQLESADADAD